MYNWKLEKKKILNRYSLRHKLRYEFIYEFYILNLWMSWPV